jgi:hypothetical protein
MKALITTENGGAYIVEVDNDAQAAHVAARDYNARWTIDAGEITAFEQHKATEAAWIADFCDV